MIPHVSRQAAALALNGCLAAAQLATTPIDWWLSRRIKLRTYLPNNFYIPRGTLVISNHVSMLDPFLITYNLGTQNWLTAVPARYPMTSHYARRPIVGHILKGLGAYDIGKTSVERAKKLLFTRDLLNKRHTVLLFPEGKIVTEGKVVAEFQHGARMLFAHDYPTVFVRLSGFTTDSFLHPETVTDARLVYSEVVHGDAETKLERLREFYGQNAL